MNPTTEFSDVRSYIRVNLAVLAAHEYAVHDDKRCWGMFFGGVVYVGTVLFAFYQYPDIHIANLMAVGAGTLLFFGLLFAYLKLNKNHRDWVSRGQNLTDQNLDQILTMSADGRSRSEIVAAVYHGYDGGEFWHDAVMQGASEFFQKTAEFNAIRRARHEETVRSTNA